MSTIHLHQTTTSTPEQFIAGLTDFGPGRAKLFGNSADEYMKVHRRGATDADVTEGSGGVWERLHDDWSDPTRVIMKTTDFGRRVLGKALENSVKAIEARNHDDGARYAARAAS